MIDSFVVYLFIFVLGIVIGSFLNLVVDRATFNKSILFPASHCPHCRRKLAFYDLIPVFSYIELGGKCRYCKQHLSLYYPVVEVFTGLLFDLFWFFIFSKLHFAFFDPRVLILGIYYMCIISSLVVIFFTDLKYGIIPFKVVFAAVLITFFLYLILPLFHYGPGELFFLNTGQYYFLNYFLSALAVFSFFFLLFFITKGRGLGFGDVVYVFLMGLLLGFPVSIVGLYIAFLSGAFISLILVVVGRKKLSGGTIPFGPFLVGGTIGSMIWGQTIIDMVMRYLMR